MNADGDRDAPAEAGVAIERVAVARILPLRHAILRRGLPADSARFAGDDHSDTLHLAASAGDEVVGCASYMRSPYLDEPAWQLRGMACADGWRGRDIGTRLLVHAERLLAADPVRLRWCNARVGAIPFYERMGWTVDSDAFDIPSAGPHRRMILRR